VNFPVLVDIGKSAMDTRIRKEVFADRLLAALNRLAVGVIAGQCKVYERMGAVIATVT
jgi:hypothetical protein